jgi:hypothetical protein
VEVALERAVAVTVGVAKVVVVAVAVEWCSSGYQVAVVVVLQWQLSGGGG